MKEIPLTQGLTALVDDKDYEELAQHKWYALKGGTTFYAMRNSPRKKGRQTLISMHRVILGAPTDMQVDHEDHNGLNNQRYNIRLTDRSGNQHNRGKLKNNTTGYKGVYWMKKSRLKPYRVYIGLRGQMRYIGGYATAEEAARAYDRAAKELHGEYAYLNFPEEG